MNNKKKKPKLTRIPSAKAVRSNKELASAVQTHPESHANKERPVIKRKKNAVPRSEKALDITLVSGVDRPFLILVLTLLCIGTVMIFTASYAYAKQNFQGDSYYFAKRQLIWVAISVVAMFITANFKYTFYEKWAPLISIAALVLLALVPIIGYSAKGAKRWIGFGDINIQPSELVKIAVVIFIAWYATKFAHYIQSFWKGLVFVMVFVGIADMLLVLQPHLSAMIIITVLAFIMLFLGGVRVRYLVGSGIVGALGILGVIILTDHGRSRIKVWLNPEEFLLGEGWQPYQSRLAIGSGGLWGVGLGQSRQKHLYLPEPQNDYIFAILCEELGFICAVAVIILFMLLVWRGFYIARNAPRRFPALVAMGLTIHIAIQVLLNIAVVTNAIPATGVSLPFFSYGGSSLVTQMAEMGIILNISKYSYIDRN